MSKLTYPKNTISPILDPTQHANSRKHITLLCLLPKKNRD